MKTTESIQNYRLEEQVGFILRQVNQRHTNLFVEMINDSLTTTQFSALAKLYEIKACSQNMLGRHTAMDAATIKGVIDRLKRKELVCLKADTTDRRRLLVTLTDKGKAVASEAIKAAINITKESLSPLSNSEQVTFLDLLSRLK